MRKLNEYNGEESFEKMEIIFLLDLERESYWLDKFFIFVCCI
jgi:hypothetical protein